LFVKHAVIIVCLCLILSGCGFRPQYLHSNGGQTTYDFNAVEISIIKDRYGQVLRNSITNFIGEGSHKKTKYIYEIQLDVSHRDLGFEKNLNTSRSEVVLLASYNFWHKDAKHKNIHGYCRTSEYYSQSKTQIFQSISAEKSAPLKGLETLSRCLTDRLVILLKTQQDIAPENK